MNRIARVALLMLFLGMAVACSKSPSRNAEGGDLLAVSYIEPPPPRTGSMLAYEHDVSVELPGKEILARLQQSQLACIESKFGTCEILSVEQSGGDSPNAELEVRIVPAGVEPMIAQASQGARIGARNTRAEDLAQAVNDTARERARLQKEMERLQEFQQRRDLSVADMIALSQRSAETETRLQAADQESAQQQRRINTQRLTLRYKPSDGESGRSEIGSALRDFGGNFSQGVAFIIRAAAYLLPLLIGLFVLIVIIRRLRRKKPTGRG